MENRSVAAGDEGSRRGSWVRLGEAEELQRRWSSPVSAALHECKLDYTEPASVRRWPTTTHKLCRLYYSSSAAFLWNTVKGTQTSLTMLAPFYKALKRDIGVKNGS